MTETTIKDAEGDPVKLRISNEGIMEMHTGDYSYITLDLDVIMKMIDLLEKS